MFFELLRTYHRVKIRNVDPLVKLHISIVFTNKEILNLLTHCHKIIICGRTFSNTLFS